jgi:hypothetical protein
MMRARLGPGMLFCSGSVWLREELKLVEWQYL